MVTTQGLAADFELDSAGTSAYHAGQSPDKRSTQTARRRSIDLNGASRQFVAADFGRFDYVIAMDRSNFEDLRRLTSDADQQRKLTLMRDWEPDGHGKDVPDPYYGGPRGFDEVLDICIRSCEGLLEHILKIHEGE
ncbi:MAG: protein tyrosine phosphatase [Myxococcales bacterium]|nr:protein tyrosine phosphatase [Myxococcales bacterium]